MPVFFLDKRQELQVSSTAEGAGFFSCHLRMLFSLLSTARVGLRSGNMCMLR